MPPKSAQKAAAPSKAVPAAAPRKRGGKSKFTTYAVAAVGVAVVGFAIFLAATPSPEGDEYSANLATNRAIMAAEKGKMDEARQIMEQVVRDYPNSAKAHYTLAIYQRQARDWEGSELHNREALRLQPHFPEACINLGVTYEMAKNREKAREMYREGAKQRPGWFMPWNSLGMLDYEEGYAERSRQNLQKALKFSNDQNDAVRIKIAIIMPAIYETLADVKVKYDRMMDAMDDLLKRKMQIGDANRDIGMVPFYLAYTSMDPKPIMDKLYRVFSQADETLNYVAPHLQQFVKTGHISVNDVPLAPGGRIKVGIVSKHFHWHSIGKLTRGMIRHMPRDKIEITVIFPTQMYDETSQEIEQSAEHFVRVTDNLPFARQQIAELKLHVLFFPDIGMEPFTYFLAYSRLAPVQAMTHGHPSTSGVKTMDYFVSFKDYEPQANQKYYTEKLVRIDGHSDRYIVPQHVEPLQNKSAFGFADTDHVYLVPQSLFKFHPLYDEMVLGVLRADPQAKVGVIREAHAGWADVVLNRMKVQGGATPEMISRIVFMDRVRNQMFLNYIHMADVMLDPYPFGGDTSSREAFLMGTPVVTRPGDMLAGRYTQAFARHVGVPELVVSDTASYVKLAVKIASDKAYREELSTKIRGQGKTKLFNDQGVVKSWETFFDSTARAVLKQ